MKLAIFTGHGSIDRPGHGIDLPVSPVSELTGKNSNSSTGASCHSLIWPYSQEIISVTRGI